MGLIAIGELPLMVGVDLPRIERFAEGVDVKIAQTSGDLENYVSLGSELFGIDKGALKRVLPPAVLSAQTAKFYLAEKEGVVCGLGATTHHKDIVGIWSMATSLELRKQGIASAVLKKMVETSSQANLFYLLATQAGQPLYTHTGFKTISTGQVFAGRFD
jgi:predicted GNAT family acetyltransferase